MRQWAMGVVSAAVVFGAGISVGQYTTRSLYRDVSVLSVPVIGTRPLDAAPFNARIAGELQTDADLTGAVAHIWSLVSVAGAREQAVLVKRLEGDAQAYRVHMLQGDAPDDDSVSGRYTTLLVTQDDDGQWKVGSSSEAWRCWDGRGHSDFDRTPCK